MKWTPRNIPTWMAAAIGLPAVLSLSAMPVPGQTSGGGVARGAGVVGGRSDGASVIAARRAAMSKSAAAGLEFLRQAQNPDGSFGDRQQRLQTAIAILAFLSSGRTPDNDAKSPVVRACQWIVANTGEDGFLGDGEYPMESHAMAATALLEAWGMMPDPAVDRAVGLRAAAAVQFALQQQDKAVGAEFYGGWKIDLKTKVNDRLVTGWYIYMLRSAELRGLDVPRSALTRALEFVEGSQHVPEEGRSIDRTDRGGFSYDASGLPVISVTSVGLAAMSMHGRAEARRDLALSWLSENQPIWFGPNFYSTHYFSARAMVWEIRRGRAQAEGPRHLSRLWDLLREHQDADGSFQVPPGNAENTKQMGATYATGMAVLVLNAERGLLPVDSLR